MSRQAPPSDPKPKAIERWQAQATQGVEQGIEWVSASPRRAIGLAATLLTMVLIASPLVLGTTRSAIKTAEEPKERVTLAMTLDALDHGYYRAARELALKLRRQGRAKERGGVAYVLGAIAEHSAAELLGDDRLTYYAIAERYLQEAEKEGFPEGREATGLLLLGKTLCERKQYAQGTKVLEQALVEGADEATTHRLLAAAFMEPPNRDLSKAIEHITAYVDDPDLSSADRQDALLMRAQLYWELGDSAACRKTLQEIPAETVVAPDAALLRGRLLLEEARALKALWKQDPTESRRVEVTAKYDQAIQSLRHGQDDPLRAATVRQSMYLIGVAYDEMEDYRAALNQFIRTRKIYLDTPEGLAAALEEADALRELEQPEEAVAAYRRALGAIPAEPPFTNPWIPVEQYRTRVLDAYRSFIDAGEFERAIAIAERLSPLFSTARQTQILADTHRVWAVKTLAGADSLKEPAATEAMHRGRALWREAGHFYEELAKEEFATRQYGDDLWLTAEAFLQGHDYEHAASSFEKYLEHELKRRRPAALAGLAEARLALNDLAGALAACQECIEFYPDDAATYRTRLLAAEAHLEKGDAEAAEAFLRQNLTDDRLTPESREWRDSLFTLGRALHADGRFEEAILRLQEAVARYPDTTQAIEARYLIAECYRAAAKVPQQKLETDTIETARIAHQKQKMQYLAGAIASFEQLQTVLNQRQEQRELTPSERAILRNSFFGLGSAQFDMGRYEDALQTYTAASNRYQHDPEVLEAFVQMANCQRRLNRPLEARGALQQAKVVLDRLPDDAPFATTTNHSRREWAELLEWLNNL